MLRRAVRASFVLLCLCILFSAYIHRVMAADAAFLKLILPILSVSEAGEWEDAAGPVPPDIAVPVATPIPVEDLAQQDEPASDLPPLPAVWKNVAGAESSAVVRQLQDVSVIVLEKREGYGGSTAFLEELPTTRQLRVTVGGIMGDALSDGQVKRIAGDAYYCGTPPTPTPTATPSPIPTGKTQMAPTSPASPTPVPTLSPSDPYYVWRNDVVKAIETTAEMAEDGSMTQTLLLTLDKTYVYQLYEDEWNYYIALIRPKDVYEKIIVVDAGHGGLDAGTISQGGAYLEKNMNLDMVLRLKELLDEQDQIKVYYTRTTDWKPSLRQRINLANDVEADFFLSVHCNANETRALHGTEVLYDSRQNAFSGMNSRRFAQILLEEMDEHLGLYNRGIVAREQNLTVIKYAEVPAALVEVAFMSNASDLEILSREEARAQVAQGLFDAIMRGYEELGSGTEQEEGTEEAMGQRKEDRWGR